jgi:hypothetical protein
MSGEARHTRRGAAAVAVVVVLIIIDLIIVGIALGGGRDHDLTVRRLQTIQAFYASEAGMNMAIRELIADDDEDSDTGIGTISADDPVDDGNDPKPPDPVSGDAQVVVTATADTPSAGQTTLTSTGRSGEARREMETILE